MLRREWTVPAAQQFESAQNHYQTLSPATATALAQRVSRALRLLAEQPWRGHAGQVPATREWKIQQTPYRLVYRVREGALQVLHVQLDTQDWIPRSEPRIERLQHWWAALITLLLHLFMLWLLLLSSKPIVTPPQGATTGGRMKVDFIGESELAEPAVQASPAPAQATSPVQSTLVKEAENPLPPEASKQPSKPVTRPLRKPTPRPNQPQPPTSLPTQRHPQTWTGRPPGMLDEDIAAQDDGLGNNVDYERGRRNDRRASQPSMEVGGYQVYYDVRSETQLRAWKAQGMQEIAIILPGTKYRMICPLEIALRRGSGKCRMLSPDSPELQTIGEGREVINMMEVYRRGEPVWRGPGPYR